MKTYHHKIYYLMLSILVFGLVFGAIAMFYRSALLQARRQQANYYAEMESLSKEYANNIIEKLNQLDSCKDDQPNIDRVTNELLIILKYSEVTTKSHDLTNLRTSKPSHERTEIISKLALEAAKRSIVNAQEHAFNKQMYQD